MIALPNSQCRSVPELRLKNSFSPKKDAPYITFLSDQHCYEDSGFVDFIAREKLPHNRQPERQISFKKCSYDLYEFHSASFQGQDLDPSWFQKQSIEISSKSGPTPSKSENINPQVVQHNVVTPVGADDIESIKKRKLNDSPAAKTFIPNNSLQEHQVIQIVEAFYKSNLSPFIRGNGGIAMDAISFDEKLSIPKLKNTQFVPLLISLEGNIGAGKSFLLARLRAAHPEWVFIDEPVDFWESLKNDKGETLLSMFYGDQKRWAFTFQHCALLSRFQNIESCIATKKEEYEKTLDPDLQVCVFITERCLDTDHQVFAKMLNSDATMSDVEYALYKKWFNLIGKEACPLSAIIWVDTEPTLCAERILKRSRSGEGGIPIDYLTKLDSFQKSWIDSTKVSVLRSMSDEEDKVDAFIAEVVKDATKSKLLR